MTKANNATLKKVAAEFKKARTVLVAGHSNPEGDALGSSLGLGLALALLRKKVKFYNADPVPKVLRFLPGWERVTSVLNPDEHYDLAVIVDVGEKDRVGEAFAKHKNFGKILCMDHHIMGRHDGDINLVMPKAAATGIVVYHVLKAMGFKKLKKEIAVNLYCAILTDTGSFKYSNTQAETLEIGAELLRSGVDPWLVAKNCFETSSRSRIELLKRVLQSLAVHPSGKIASIDILLADFEASGATQDETEGMINYARSVEGVEVAACFRQTAPNEYKVSFRSNSTVDVARLAQKFGGGGHMRASGCKMEGPLEQVKKRIFDAILETL